MLALAPFFRGRRNARADHTSTRDDPFHRFQQRLPCPAIPDQVCEWFQVLLEWVRPAASPFHLSHPFSLTLFLL